MLLRVTSLSPDFTEGFINLGVFYIRTQATDKAVHALDRALETSKWIVRGAFQQG